MQSKILIVLAIILSFGVGIFIGTKVSKNFSSQDKVISGDKYQAGWSAAIQSLKDAGSFPQTPAGIEIKSINGKIKAISGNTITLQITAPGLMSTPELAIRTVLIDSKTKIVQYVQKDPIKYQEELDAFNEKNKQQATPQEGETVAPQSMSTPPVAHNINNVTADDLKLGQSISVQAAMVIGDAQKFVATEIQITQEALDLSNMLNVPPAPDPETAKVAPQTSETIAPAPPIVE